MPFSRRTPRSQTPKAEPSAAPDSTHSRRGEKPRSYDARISAPATAPPQSRKMGGDGGYADRLNLYVRSRVKQCWKLRADDLNSTVAKYFQALFELDHKYGLLEPSWTYRGAPREARS